MTTVGFPSPAPTRPRRWLRRCGWLALLVVVALGGAEAFLRIQWGLGSPVLFELEPRIEYLQRPDQDLRRFGNRILVNEFGMRSPAFPARKTDPDELRVLVLGDSVVNGGVQTDHDNLATTLLAKDLAAATGRPVVVGNASAGSWGPPNLLAYTDRFGFLDADIVAIVLSSHDAADAPSGTPPDPRQMPTSAPLCALSELFTRYLPGRWPGGQAPPPRPGEVDRLDDTAAVELCRTSLEALIRNAKAAGAKVLVLQHWDRAELEARAARAGHDLIAAIADREHAPRQDLAESYAADGGAACFRDQIHLSDQGQRALCAAMLEAIKTHGLVP